MIPTRSLKTEGRSKGEEMMKQILATIVSHGMPPTCQQRFPFSGETKKNNNNNNQAGLEDGDM